MSRAILSTIVLTLILSISSPLSPNVSAEDGATAPYRTGFVRWRAADSGFAAWTLNGTWVNESGELEFDPLVAFSETDPYDKGAFEGGQYYNGGSFLVGEATSPVISTPFRYKEAVPSWNAMTPDGSWIEIQLRAHYGSDWSKWYVLGIWASKAVTVSRHSVDDQRDANATVNTDTFASRNPSTDPNDFQLRFRLFSEDGAATPRIRNASVAFSSDRVPSAVSTGNSALWNRSINIPSCSQMVYPDGGEVWCSPTSLSMVLGYWNNDAGPCEPRVRAAVESVFDWIYPGHGNWPFNTAYAATQGYEAYVARFSSLAQIEEFIAAGVPVVTSIAWGTSQLSGAPIASTNGHLLVVVGFDAAGNPIVHDPAASTDAGVARTYRRSEFEPLWLKASGGMAYVVYPSDRIVPSLPS